MKRAFTLIELLVVIAIIAILAAILFPVFAQAKAAAKSAADLSNIKQLALGNIMYLGDSDDQYPQGADASWTSWPVKIYPYIKSLNLMKSPSDNGQLKDNSTIDGWIGLASGSLAEGANAGVAISYAANGYNRHGWGDATLLRGPFGNMFNNWGEAGSALTLNAGQITQPAGTIILGSRQTAWLLQQKTPNDGSNGYVGVASALSLGNTFAWTNQDTALEASVPQAGTCINCTGPDSNYPLTGADGGVTPGSGGKSSFAFADGHAKSLKPSSTNPDETNQTDKNLWDALR